MKLHQLSLMVWLSMVGCSAPPAPQPECEAGDQRCGEIGREVCIAGQFEAAPCTAGEKCVEEGNCACEAGTARCEPGRQVCGPEGDWVDAPCPTGATCSGEGECAACTPGEARCSAGAREECTPDRAWQPDLCPGAFPVCVGAGACTVCQAGATRCQGGIKEECNPTGTAWLAQTCPGATPYCAGEGECSACPEAIFCTATLFGFNAGDAWVEASLGLSFAHPLQVVIGTITGDLATLLGDVDGDGGSDAIAWQEATIAVSRSGLGRLLPPSGYWVGSSSPTARARLSCDVDGDGLDDLIDWQDDDVWVLRSEATAFAAPTSFLSQDVPGDVFFAGDVDGDGRCDLVTVSATAALVCLSTGSAFLPPVSWLVAPPAATVGHRLGDLSGDGKADLVAWRETEIVVGVSTGAAFEPSTFISGVPFYSSGEVGDFVMDVDGDGMDDLVASNPSYAFMERSTGSALEQPYGLIGGVPFFGSVTNLSGTMCFASSGCGE